MHHTSRLVKVKSHCTALLQSLGIPEPWGEIVLKLMASYFTLYFILFGEMVLQWGYGRSLPVFLSCGRGSLKRNVRYV